MGALIMFGLLDFLSGFITAKIFSACEELRIPKKIELVGLDLSEFRGRYIIDEEVENAEKRKPDLQGSSTN